MRSVSPFRSGRGLTSWDSALSDLFGDFERSFDNFPQARRDFSPALDVEEKEGVYLVTMDVPGIKKDDIQINLSERTLTISGERTRENRGQGHYYERSYGRFARSLTLPENVQEDAIEAHYEDGILKLVLPKAEETKAKTIKVQSGKTGGLLEKFFGGTNKEQGTTTEKDPKH